MKKMINLLIILIIVSLIFSGCTDVNVPEITDELTKKMTIVTFTVTPSIIEAGSTANLSWVVTGSDTTVNIDNGIGSVSLTGYRIISPTQTITYKLTATNSTSTENATTQIIVTINTNEENNNTKEENNNQTVLTVQEVYKNKDSYIDKNITVEGYFYISINGPCLISSPTTIASASATDIKINLDETSLNSAKQEAKNITISSNLKYRVVGILQKVQSSLGTNYYMIVESIKAVLINMKKQLVIIGIIIILLTVGLSGCNQQSTNNKSKVDLEKIKTKLIGGWHRYTGITIDYIYFFENNTILFADEYDTEESHPYTIWHIYGGLYNIIDENTINISTDISTQPEHSPYYMTSQHEFKLYNKNIYSTDMRKYYNTDVLELWHWDGDDSVEYHLEYTDFQVFWDNVIDDHYFRFNLPT
ncbi:MAG: hypothetical protein MUO82_03620 [Candidatus Thermoplasmatota archaeon]|nr:hypothetical protein [Candidatus Thermoplasmatota archaeon]